MENRGGFVYLLICVVNGKGYVGQTVKQPERRWAEHVAAALRGDRRPLYAAMRKYGFKNFNASILWHGSEVDLNAAEIRFVRKCKTFIDGGWGYNLTTGGRCFRLARRSIRKIRRSLIRFYKEHPERRLVISEQNVVRMSNDTVRQHLSEVATKQFENYAARRSMSRIKRRQYAMHPEIIEKLSVKAGIQWSSSSAHEEKSVMSRHGWSVRLDNGTDHASGKARLNMSHAQRRRFEDPAARKKISDGQLRRYQSSVAHEISSAAQYRRFAERPMSAETNAKIAARTKWNWAHNPEFRARMLKVLHNRPPDSAETRARRSESLRASWARRKAAV
jgi:group I intron endonuclease